MIVEVVWFMVFVLFLGFVKGLRSFLNNWNRNWLKDDLF